MFKYTHEKHTYHLCVNYQTSYYSYIEPTQENTYMYHTVFEIIYSGVYNFKCLNYLQAGPYDSLKDVALKLLQTKVATIPIIHSSSQDGSFPQLLHLASLSGVLKCKLFLLIYQSKFHNLLLTNLLSKFQVFAGILDILLALCLSCNNQFVQFLWVHGFQKLGNQMVDH